MTEAKRKFEKQRCLDIIKENIDYEREEHEDRNVLESIIIPEILATLDPKTILDIGREDYQVFYNDFFEDRELWTIERKASRRKYGAANHVTDDVSKLRKHFKADYFDFVMMNGVFGWGLNKPKAIESAFSAIYEVMKPGGIFILGWNNLPGLVPMPLEEITALKKLTPFCFAPLKGDCFKCINGEHTYSFFQKKK